MIKLNWNFPVYYVLCMCISLHGNLVRFNVTHLTHKLQHLDFIAFNYAILVFDIAKNSIELTLLVHYFINSLHFICKTRSCRYFILNTGTIFTFIGFRDLGGYCDIISKFFRIPFKIDVTMICFVDYNTF